MHVVHPDFIVLLQYRAMNIISFLKARFLSSQSVHTVVNKVTELPICSYILFFPLKLKYLHRALLKSIHMGKNVFSVLEISLDNRELASSLQDN